LPIGVIRWQTAEVVRIVETIQIEEKVVPLHIMVQRTGVSSTGEVAKTGGRRTKKSVDNNHIVI
jgi:hypothetical protein